MYVGTVFFLVIATWVVITGEERAGGTPRESVVAVAVFLGVALVTSTALLQRKYLQIASGVEGGVPDARRVFFGWVAVGVVALVAAILLAPESAT